ncbi:uncharacterized protein LOC143037347 [Oratosquilla oratoria]|uniref:uncharacterized protein LOC143037347 n=1 Tax=Oratosquilla oratoria TaxID=337810 RepID=UPI003F76CB39
MDRAARLIKGQSRRERITPVLIPLHWLPVKARIKYKKCVMVYQAMKFGSPNYLCDMLVDFQIDTDIALRHSIEVNRLLGPRFCRESGRRAFVNSAPRPYNRFPENVKMAETTTIFKKTLKTHFITASYDLENVEPNVKLTSHISSHFVYP